MTVHVKVGGSWKTAASVHNKVSGVWKTASDMPVKVSGVWKTGVLATGSFESIATATLSSTTTNITLSSIPSTYKHLQLRILTRASNASVDRAITLRVNSDSGSNYAQHYLDGDGSTASASGSASTTSMLFTKTAGASATANVYGVAIVDFVDYASSSKYKTIKTFGGFDNNGAGNVILSSGLWQSTTAINSITVVNTSFLSGSTIALYGIRG